MTTEPARTAFRLGQLLHRASQLADDRFAAQTRDLDLTARQLVVLDAIARLERPSQMNVCTVTGIDRSTIADMVMRLIAKGYVERRRSRTDSRRYILQLTDKGATILAQARPVAQQVERALAEALPPDSLDRLLRDLETITGLTHEAVPVEEEEGSAEGANGSGETKSAALD